MLLEPVCLTFGFRPGFRDCQHLFLEGAQSHFQTACGREQWPRPLLTSSDIREYVDPQSAWPKHGMLHMRTQQVLWLEANTVWHVAAAVVSLLS